MEFLAVVYELQFFVLVAHVAVMGWEEVEVQDGDTITIVPQGFAQDYVANLEGSSRRQWGNIHQAGWQ